MRESNEKESRQEIRLEDQEQIVNQYLEALLSEVVEYNETEIEVKQKSAEVITISPSVEIAPEEVQQALIEEQEEEERPAPDWAREPFQCLIFRVGNITLATPLLALDNIIKWDTDLTPMPFQPDWHLGVLQNRDDKIVVVDTASLLMLEQSEEKEASRENGSHILIIGDHHFGLACDSLAKPLFLSKEDVHWSIKHPDRPWMAGTVKEKLTILLDIDALLKVIRHE